MGFFSAFNKGVNDAQASIDANLQVYRRIKNGSTLKGVVYVNEEEGLFYFTELPFDVGLSTPKVFNLSDLASYTVIEDGEQLITGGLSLTRAVAGSLIAGPAGMVLGGLTGDKKMKTTIRAVALKLQMIDNSSYIVNFIKKPIEARSVQYVQLKHALQLTCEYFETALDKNRE